MNLSQEFKKGLLERMKLIRFVEEGIADRYPAGNMRCPTHLSIGQEAAAAGVAAALQNEDLAISTHRAHAHYIAKGGNIRSMLAEIYGKAAGCCGGRGGSMHLIDRSVGFMGSTAIVGNSIPVGVGLGLSLQLKKTKQVSITYFGDGATEEGAFYESVNFAVVRKLPVLFLCENNFYSVYSPLSVRQPAQRKIYEMAAAMGLNTAIADGNNIEETYVATAAAIEEMRNGGGPFLLELTTYRWREHCGPSYDNHIGYRTNEEFEEWEKKDPIYNYEKKLLEKGDITENEIISMNQRVLEEVNSAFDFAENAPFPDEDFAYTGLFAINK
jgi:TPP-dependent pyruvate/acetoin dehydrogenase alpha subunit